MMRDLIRDFFKEKKIAVAGSFKDESKYAYKILKLLKEKGYEVYPINPTAKEVLGIPCYKSVKDVQASLGAIDIVTPPGITEKIVKECKEKNIKVVWMQPGAESENAIKFCSDNGIKIIYNHCVLVEGRWCIE